MFGEKVLGFWGHLKRLEEKRLSVYLGGVFIRRLFSAKLQLRAECKCHVILIVFVQC